MAGDSDLELQGIGLSLGHELNSIVGVFARIGCQDDDAVVDHDSLYSGGINISGELWGRGDDAAGLGYAYLNGASKGDIDNTQAAEAYVKFQVCEFSDISLDFQYLKDKVRDDDNRDGFIYGIRMQTSSHQRCPVASISRSYSIFRNQASQRSESFA